MPSLAYSFFFVSFSKTNFRCTNWSIPPPHLPQQWPPYDATMWAGLNQSLSSGAQTATIAFANFAWATGDLCADTFLPPGKVADIYGFQYVRDGTADGFFFMRFSF